MSIERALAKDRYDSYYYYYYFYDNYVHDMSASEMTY